MDDDPDTLYAVYRDNHMLTTFTTRERAQEEIDWQIEDDMLDDPSEILSLFENRYRIVEFKQVK